MALLDDKKASELVKQLEQELEEQLLESNEFFDLLVDMIPSKLYVAGQSGDDFNPKYFKGASEKEARKAAAKAAKRQKLDPAVSQSTKEVNTKGSAGDGVPSLQPAASQQTPGESRIEALRAKLHAKIASKQQRPASAETVSKRSARRAEKNRRKAEALKRKSASGSTKANEATKNTSYTITPTTPAADPMQDLQHVDYGLISGLNTDTKTNYLEANKALSSKGKNLHKLLADAEAKRQKLQALKNSSDAKDKEKAAAIQWSDTFKEADGVRVKDDPAKLKKAVKRKEAKKHKSQKAWKVRLEQQSETAKNRQQIRQHNLQTRKQGGSAGANLSKKKIADPAEEEKKGRRGGRAGFEGRKQDFLNSPKDGVVAGKKKKQQ